MITQYILKLPCNMSMTFPHQADFTGNMIEYNGSRGIPDSWYTTKQPASGNDPAETTYQCFMRKIVYRLRMVSASFKKSVKPGDTFDFSLS